MFLLLCLCVRGGRGDEGQPLAGAGEAFVPLAPPQVHRLTCACRACRMPANGWSGDGWSGDVAPGSNPPGGGVLSTTIPPSDPNGVFAAPYVAGTDSRTRTARSLLVYLHDAGTPDMYNKTLSTPVLGATTRYEYLQKVANDQRQWLAVNSGGRMDSTYEYLDSGGIGYKDPATNQKWSNAFDVLPSILTANGITQSNYDYIQMVYDDVWGSPHFEGTNGAAGVGYVGNGYGTEIFWALNYARRHELGHNLGFGHANSLRSQNNPADGSYSTSLYRYDFANQTYVSATSVRNNTTDQLASPTIGLVRNDYGNPLDVMASNNNAQFGTRDKQQAGWLDGRHFATITGTADGAVTSLLLHDPAELVAVTTGSGGDIRYGVARGYADVPYTATLYRRGQEFVADVSGTSGSWNMVVQRIDLTTVQLTGTTYGIEFRLDDAYVGVIQAGQSVSERDIAQYNRIITSSPWSGTVGPDLVNDLHAGAPDNPARYRSTWFDLRYAATGTDSIGSYTNLQVTTHVGSTLGGSQWDASGGSAGAQDGGGTWAVGTGGWRDVDANLDDQAWTDGASATFGAATGAAGTVTVSGTVAARNLTFRPAASGTYALSGGAIALGAMGVNADASAVIGSNLSWSADQVWEIAGGRAVTLSGSVTPNGKALGMVGSGSLVLMSSGTLPTLRVIEGAAIQRTAQSPGSVTLGNTARYDVEAGTLTMTRQATISGGVEAGQLRLLSGTASSAASPDIAFYPENSGQNVTTTGGISADVELGEGRHVITSVRTSFNDYDRSVSNGLYKPATISGDISGPGGIDFVGSVTSAQLVLSGSNSFTGDLRIQRGSVHLVGGDAMGGAPTVTFDTSATSGDARLYLRGTTQTVTNLSSTGPGPVSIANAPAGSNGGQRDAMLSVHSTADTTFGGVLVDTLREASTSSSLTSAANPLGLVKTGTATLSLTGNSTYTGPTVVSAGELKVGAGGTAGSIGSGSITANGTLAFDRSDTVVLSQTLSGGGVVRQQGAGQLRLTGSGGFTGNIQVVAGSLDADGTYAGSTVSVAAGTMLTGSGTVGAVTVAGGATLGGSAGSTLTTAGLTLADLTVVTAHLDRATAPGLFRVNGALVLDGLLDVISQDVMWGGVYRLFDYTGSLVDNGLQIRSLPSDVDPVAAAIQTSVAGQVNFTLDTGSNFWDGAGTPGDGSISGGSGIWRVGLQNWSNSAGTENGLFERVPTFAVFQATSGTVTVDNSSGQVAAAGLQFATNGYRVTGGAVELRDGRSGTMVLRVGDGSTDSAGMTATIDSVLSGTGNITKTDAGTAVLAAANTFTGGITIRSGTVVATTLADGGATSALGRSSAAATNLVLDGGAVRFTPTTPQSTDRSFTLGTGGGTLDASPAAGGSVALTSSSAIVLAGSGPRTLSLAGSGAGSLAAIIGDGLGGVTSLMKTGTGIWTLTGVSTYTGSTTISAGTFEIGGAGKLGGGTYAATITNNGRLVFSGVAAQTISGVVSGTGALHKSGSGTVELSGANTISGSMSVVGGTLRVTNTMRNTPGMTVGNGATLELSATNMFVTNHGVAVDASRVLTADGGTLLMGGSMDSRIGNVSLANGGTWTSNRGVSDYDVLLANTSSGAATVTVSGTGAARMNGSGGIHLQGVQEFAVANTTGDANPDLTVSMILTGPGSAGGSAGGITKTGAGTMVISSNSSYNGPTTVSDGTLRVQGTLRSTSAMTVGQGATLELGATNMFVSGHGTAVAASRVLTADGGTLLMNASMDSRIGNVTLANGGTWTSDRGLSGYDILLADTTTGAATVTVGGTGAARMNGSGGIHLQGVQEFAVANTTGDANPDLTVSMILTGPGSAGGTAGGITKTGAGTMVMTGSNSFTGGVRIAAGKVVATHPSALGTGTVVIDGSTAELAWNAAAALTQPLTFTQGTLSGTATIGVAVTVATNRTLSPGNSPGVQALAAGLTLGPQGTYEWEITNAAGVKGIGWDLATVSGGSLDLSGLSAAGRFTLDLITLASLDTPGAMSNYTPGGSYLWRLFDATSLILPTAYAGSSTGVGTYTAGSDVTSLFTLLTSNWLSALPSLNLFSMRVGSDGSGLDLVLSASAAGVPEIDPRSSASVAALVVGALAWWERRRRTV